jgi:chromosome segregation ATPase
MSSTKTVSFRLPMDEYIKYLQKATSMNLGPADYALLKIYSEEKEQEEIEELKLSNSQIKAEYEDFQAEVRENYAKEVAKATEALKAKYEAELKAKEAETKKLISQKDELVKKIAEIETAKETAIKEIAELQKRLQEISETSKQQIQTIKAEAAKQLHNKDTAIQNLESKIETAKQESKQLIADTKSKLQKVQTEAEQKMKKLEADLNTKWKANTKQLIAEIDKATGFAPDKGFREKWEKRAGEL